ncbi:MAG: heat shock protein HspQ [Magnetococcales bacterium]|nr:heat shock protein HspQ [Magnetococcales bacterium]MBF0151916.1 heat shock protein HspQ [Magnetococcales bacterium]MBF0174806.1 heat shock protein HspQ [Magnetococcales bacterium]MBF0630440.1 heat shock protein HspQ [Magnetococcales bacterium]
MNPRVAKFSIGQIIQHNLFDYRGVIVDIDPMYQKDDAWYDRMARTRPPRDQPWYQILVHESDSETYVAERNLSPDNSAEPVENPRLAAYFRSFSHGRYIPRNVVH